MKNQWLIWFIVVGVVILVLFTFNYQSGQDVLPLGEVFPEDETGVEPPIEYEFVQSDGSVATPQERIPAVASTAVPVAQPPAEKPAGSPPAVRPQDLEQKDFSKIPFTIQVLSSKDKLRAQEALQKVKDAGYPTAYLATKDLGDKGLWHRIYVGTFPTKEEADQYLPQVKKAYPDSFIIRNGK
ncbi:MAG: SPOR domain-containing protein [Candidatus Omnitrophota bacterium]|jgi:cell division septation protein DedD